MGELKRRISLVVFIFLLGVVVGIVTNVTPQEKITIPTNTNCIEAQNPMKELASEPSQLIIQKLMEKPTSRDAPQDRIKETNIKTYTRRVTIDVDNAIIAKFADTKSMEPVITKDANAIEIIPKDINDIQVGDIISYKSAFSTGTIIHRVVEKNIDEQGVYFRTKGDNLDYTDPEKIRFNQVQRVVVGILY